MDASRERGEGLWWADASASGMAGKEEQREGDREVTKLNMFLCGLASRDRAVWDSGGIGIAC